MKWRVKKERERFIMPVSKALRYGPCVTRRSHSFTCHSNTKNTTNHTCLYSPAARQRHRFGWYSLRLPTKGWPGQAELSWVAGQDVGLGWQLLLYQSRFVVYAITLVGVMYTLEFCPRHFVRQMTSCLPLFVTTFSYWDEIMQASIKYNIVQTLSSAYFIYLFWSTINNQWR